MKVSEITNKELADYLRLEYDELTIEEAVILDALYNAAKQYITAYTGLTLTQVDAHDDFVIVIYVLVQDMYDNRTLYIEKNNLNKVVETILGMHSINLL